MFKRVFFISILVVFCSVILFPSISISSVPAIVGQDDGGTGNSPVSFNTGEQSMMSQSHQVNVNVTTGNLIVKNTDLVIPTKGKDIVISRTYNSLNTLNGIEEGLEIYVQPDSGPSYGGPYSDSLAFTITKGAVRINGDRV
ncbi:MAG: DUF6531 domain-containing protein, partial [bacterium]